MTIDEIRKLKWNTLSSNVWEEQLPMTNIGKFKKKYASKEDVETFISDQISITARKLNIDYIEFLKLVKSENQAFYTFFDYIYENYAGLGGNSLDMLNLQNFFKLPTIPNKQFNPVEDVLLRFEKLTDFQKIEVLEKLKLISIRINKNPE